MPTVLASKQFQNQYKEWIKQYKANPARFEVQTVFQKIGNDLSALQSDNENKTPWSAKDLKGLTLFTEFTSLFLETHKIPETQVDQITQIIKQPRVMKPERWYSYDGSGEFHPYELERKIEAQIKDLESHLLASEELTSTNRKLNSKVVEKLDSKINTVQRDLKSDLMSRKALHQKARKSKILGVVAITGTIGAVIAAAILTGVLAMPVILLGGLFAATSLGIAGAFLFGNREEYKAQEANMIHEIGAKNEEIHRLVEMKRLAETNEFQAFTEQIDPFKLDAILEDDSKLPQLLELFSAEKTTKELEDRIGKWQSKDRKSQYELEIERLNQLSLIEELRADLHLDPATINDEDTSSNSSSVSSE